MRTRKKVVAIILIFAFSVGVFFFFFAPGAFFGGINYISPDSHIRIIQRTYTRAAIDGSNATVFRESQRIEHELTSEQVEGLRRLLRSSWYTRSFRNVLFYSVPLDVDSYCTYIISISNIDRYMVLNFGWSGHVLRGEKYNDWIRVRNSNWENELLRIINSA